MQKWWLVAILAVAVSCGGGAEPTSAPTPSAGTIERLDPAFDELVPTDAVIEHLADGFGFTEGPVWVDAEDGFLLFSDIPGNRIVKWEQDGTVTLAARKRAQEADFREELDFPDPRGVN